MSSPVDRHAEYHLLYGIINAPVRGYPFPHLYLESAFPPDFYREMLAAFPIPDKMRPIGEVRPGLKDAYPDRFIITLDGAALGRMDEARRRVWTRLSTFLLSTEFREMLLWKFGATIQERFSGAPAPRFRSEILLVDDRQNYALGPHSDNMKKVITLLFYLPDTADDETLGTSIYVPNDPTFTCAGGPEYPVAGFQRVATMPYRPNALFAFPKTDRSFHGVERVAALAGRRKLMLFDIYLA